ncbi:chemotaxis protein CheB [Sulfuriflexus sp.]|uniref:chemotaxis protein CheB n=1 Tax=Sulfuriflexus sp. TaxID=2015443 RepID=UPI0028CCE42D|nr:chemotaxis protein CheB [Sulfuriflexus sp.]MDT8404250.1 chemotaxis protein CheB [Sulfuriflexus sp.]
MPARKKITKKKTASKKPPVAAKPRKKATAKKAPVATAPRKKMASKKTPLIASSRKKTATGKQKKATSPAMPEHGDTDFLVVGIGASAGGLEAVTELLQHLPADTGMAFVLVQHLAPGHKSMMTELLARETILDVSEVTDGMKVRPNHVYVIPPNTNLGIFKNALHLMPREAKGQHLPIDYFFQSLAKERGSKAIAVILSGSASDGTLGLKAIKAGDGITFAQALETAHYDSMPASAIATGCVDFVLPPKDIANELAHLARHPAVLRTDLVAGKEDRERIDGELEKIFWLLRNRTGNDFTYYKTTSIQRRISRRMLMHKIERLKDYVRYLGLHPVELDALFQDILINVTSFFRDPDAFSALKKKVFPMLVRERSGEHPVRIWVPGCSTGEEVYSIIMVLIEFLDDDMNSTPIQVFASDIDEQAIARARAAIYPEGIVAEVSRERLQRFFTKVPQGYQINKRLRDLCIFAVQNITKDPPFSHQDLIACRNMMIYMNTTLQRKVLQTLHYALNQGGYLFLGTSETVGASADMFAAEDEANKIYRKKDVSRQLHYHTPNTGRVTSPPASMAVRKLPRARHEPVDLQRLAEAVILNQYSPAAVVINERMDVVQFIGFTGPYLAPAPGAASLNLIKLEHPNLTMELHLLVRNALRDKASSRREGLHLRHNGNMLEINIEVLPLPEQGSEEAHYLVLFRKVAEHAVKTAAKGTAGKKQAPSKEAEHIKRLEQELADARAYSRSIIEDQEAANEGIQATNEELQSTNEELQSTNEELQSTNEELETSKEELQSTNEELITVNEELENRNTELSTSNDDLNNLIASTDLPLIMLDEALKIRFFSPRTRDLLNLIDGDVGRSIGDIRLNFDIGDIVDHVRKVIESLHPLATKVRDDEGYWYTMRITPYRTSDNRIKGALIIFVDITDSKLLQRASRLATVVEDSNDAITVHDLDGHILAWNPRAVEIYGYSEEEALNVDISIIVPEDKRQKMGMRINKLRQGQLVRPISTQRLSKDGKLFEVIVTMSLLKNERGEPEAIATTERPLTD